MSLYVPSHFATRDDVDVRALISGHPFATLITTTTAADPCITHLPLLLEGDVLLGHMARANPHWQHFAGGETVAVFHGPHAYISPSWYVNPQREVPTWNYSTVHAHGHPQLIEPAADKIALIDRTTELFERGNTPPWTRQVEGARLEGMLNAIVAFRMPMQHVEAKFKMNQNRTTADRLKVIHHLNQTSHPELQAMADWMKSHERD